MKDWRPGNGKKLDGEHCMLDLIKHLQTLLLPLPMTSKLLAVSKTGVKWKKLVSNQRTVLKYFQWNLRQSAHQPVLVKWAERMGNALIGPRLPVCKADNGFSGDRKNQPKELRFLPTLQMTFFSSFSCSRLCSTTPPVSVLPRMVPIQHLMIGSCPIVAFFDVKGRQTFFCKQARGP